MLPQGAVEATWQAPSALKGKDVDHQPLDLPPRTPGAMSTASSPASMMTPESENGSLAPGSPRLDSQDCRIMIRRLLLRYGRHEIERLVDEESCEASLCKLTRRR